MKEQADKYDNIKSKNTGSSKDTVKKIKATTEQEGIFTKRVSDKGLVCKLQKYTCNNKKKRKIAHTFKNAKYLIHHQRYRVDQQAHERMLSIISQ